MDTFISRVKESTQVALAKVSSAVNLIGLPKVELDRDWYGDTSSENASYSELCPDHCSECIHQEAQKEIIENGGTESQSDSIRPSVQ